MSKAKTKINKQSIFNSHLTATISIALVLFMLGVMGTLGLTAKKLSDYVKENIGFSVVLNDNAKEVDVKRLQKYLDATDYVKTTEYISKEQAAKELSEDLGEDFITFLGFNPLLSSIEVKLHAEYANPDSLTVIENEFHTYPQIKEVIYQKNLVHLVNDNIQRISLIILGFSALLLIISMALISNTIRLTVYSKRFIIRTMQLVGAKRSFIRRPIIGRNIINGIVAAFLAMGLLMALLMYMQKEINKIVSLEDLDIILMVFGGMLVIGILITQLSAYFAVNKYLRMQSDDLYF